MFSKDIAIDLGTANTLVYVKRRGVVVNEPSIVAMERRNNKVLAVGIEARRMAGRTSDEIRISRPLRDGVIADYTVTEAMLRYFMDKALKRSRTPWEFFIGKPRLVVGVPSGGTQVERRAVEDAGIAAGAREVYLIEEPMAAAIGSGLPVTEPRGCMILDIGGGTTEAAVISMGGMVASKSSRVAGDEMNEDVSRFFRQQYNLLIGEYTAEGVKINIGSAYPVDVNKTTTVKGRDLLTGLPKMVEVTAEEIRLALQKAFASIADVVKSTLEITPPELSADILDRGLVVSGGSALIKGLDVFLAKEVSFPVHLSPKPMEAVVLGGGKALEELHTFRKILHTARDQR